LLAAGRKAARERDHRAAMGLLAASAGKAREENDPPAAADAVLALAGVMTLENMSRDALAPLESALQLPGIDEMRRAQLRLTLADCRLRAGRPRQALATLEAGGGIAREALVAAMLRSRAKAALRDPDASAELESVRDAALADRLLGPEYLLLLAARQGEQGQVGEARGTLAALARRLREDAASSPLHAIGGLRLLAGLGDAPASDLSARLRETALARSAPRDGALRSMAFGYSGQIAEEQGKTGEALDWTRRALLPSAYGTDPGLGMLWNWQLARLLKAQGEFKQAEERFQAAFELAAAPRFDESLPAGMPSFCGHERPQDLFRDYADFLLEHGGRIRASPEAAWREALAIMNARREMRIRDFLQDQCLASLVGREKAVEQVAPGSAILHVLVLRGRTEALLQVGGRIYRHPLEIPEADLHRQVKTFQDQLTNFPSTAYRVPGRQLFDWLILPFENQLKGVDTLVVATDGPLQLIPFGALYDGSRFLIERVAVATTPSLHLLDARPTRVKDAPILAVGLKQDVTIDRQEFPALKGVDREMDTIRAVSTRNTIRLDDEFTPRKFQEDLLARPYSIVHVVSHATVGSDPEDFFIVSKAGKIDLDGLDQAIRPALYRQQPLELLVLSACETAVGDDRNALGLAGVAMKAGARSTIASLWNVPDQPSAEMLATFYATWFSGEAPSKAQALRQGQLTLLKNPAFRRHPRYWAPYILIGNWQ
jgi:CHAT domain-containing protein